MADRPILFSAPMVQALLREAHQPGTGKTQTRRILKPQPPDWATFCQQPDMLNVEHRWVPSRLWRWSEPEQTPRRALRAWPVDAEGEHYWMRLPWQVGDRLWVRESWRTLQKVDCLKPRDLADDRSKVTYEADPENRNPLWVFGKRRPSLFMPRWASRLTLLVTDVRVERLQGISEADAIAEGIERLRSGRGFYDPTLSHADSRAACRFGGYFETATHAFEALWRSINGADAWEENPWVVAVTFSVHARNIDQLAPIAEAAE
ncbi:hypothetical protein ABID82_002434 [Methylobacterium sp. PvP062]|uniref:TnsA-like heteromeric transposase endonuclease subunit n=1 Tax=Methylobacterium radiotolerans TaxID=31998 RepID=A0ABV2NNF1_9HYPH|nr:MULTISPECIES: hypothetical protein [unclassified Methylobacterium]MBP2495235.1 hypothetical protein [Methylobacterium sp. PvP105]MBP2504894.1 hypothetical protein [Methylobacterium sp. PvP109]MCX7335900.1 hypothetical protein [Hyphomicrobiales bacterium]